MIQSVRHTCTSPYLRMPARCADLQALKVLFSVCYEETTSVGLKWKGIHSAIFKRHRRRKAMGRYSLKLCHWRMPEFFYFIFFNGSNLDSDQYTFNCGLNTDFDLVQLLMLRLLDSIFLKANSQKKANQIHLVLKSASIKSLIEWNYFSSSSKQNSKSLQRALISPITSCLSVFIISVSGKRLVINVCTLR